MTNSGMTSYDAVTLETSEHRKRLEYQDRAFVAQLRAAILAGLESRPACWGTTRASQSKTRTARAAARVPIILSPTACGPFAPGFIIVPVTRKSARHLADDPAADLR